MRRVYHLLFSPASRLTRLMIGEKRLACDEILAEDASAHLPLFIEEDQTRYEGLWAIVDYLEGEYPEHPLFPEDAGARREALRWLDMLLGQFPERVTNRIVFEKASPQYTGAPMHASPNTAVIRQGRERLHAAMTEFGSVVEARGYLTSKNCTIADLALAANISALDYFNAIKWNNYPPMHEWYMRIKSRPAMRMLLADSIPGQKPAQHYGELDF